VGRLKQALRDLILRSVASHSGRLSGLLSEQARLFEIVFEYLQSERIPGDYAEFGVFQGATFSAAWHAARRRRLTKMRFHAFDSFCGLPEIAPEDADGAFRKGEFASERRAFERHLRWHGVDFARVTVTEGMFQETLTPDRRGELRLEQIAIAYVDCDLYASAVPVLDFVSDLLVDGAVLIFDDWYCFRGRPDRGEQRACAEWLAAHPDLHLIPYHQFHWAGFSFLVHRQLEARSSK
jgi:hypothetical protein